MSSEKTGLDAALDLENAAKEISGGRGAGAGETQDDLFGGVGTQSIFGELVAVNAKSVGPGRPKGSRNKSTEQLVKLICEQGRHPLIAMAEIVATPIDQIAKKLGCKMIEAAQYQRQVMSDLAPYVASKQPIAIHAEVADAPTIMINLGQYVANQAGGLPMGAPLEENNIVEKQELNQIEAVVSHDKASHE